MNLKHLNTINILCFLAVLTVSFDIFLVIDLGFNFRATQIFLFIPMLAVICDAIKTNCCVSPPGLKPLLVWTIFILIFIPNSGFIPRGLAYGFWLIFSVLTIITITRIFSHWSASENLFKWYLFTFLIISLFGIVQFILPFLGFSAPLVVQWWFPGKIARVNGFSYEPSYYSSYLIIGWILTGSLLKDKVYIFNKKLLVIEFSLVTIALILSSSRMGWIIMVLWIMQFPIHSFSRLLRLRLNLISLKVSACLFLIAFMGSFFISHFVGIERLLFLADGLGIAGRSSHSSSTRTNEFIDTLTVFASSPVIGYSLGGVSPAIANLRGIEVHDIETAKANEGMSVLAEVISASGIFGTIPFIVYLYILFTVPLKLAKKSASITQSSVVRGMVMALFFEFLILQMNQNILRPYLWMHIAILSAITASIKNSFKDYNYHMA